MADKEQKEPPVEPAFERIGKSDNIEDRLIYSNTANLVKETARKKVVEKVSRLSTGDLEQ